MKQFKHHRTSLFLIVCYYIIISTINWNIIASNWSKPSQIMFELLSIITLISIQFESKYGESI